MCDLRRGSVSTAKEFQFQTLFSALHGPIVIRTKDWFQQKRERPDDLFIGANHPVVSHIYDRAVLYKGPNAATFEIARRLHREAMRIARFNRAKIYSQGVREPAAGAQAN